MRFLHTSDWHLGRQFHQFSLLDEQAAAVDAMVELARSERVDAVLVAGDLFDRAIPSTSAVELLDDALVRLRDTGAVVVAITGNHDSASRAGFGDRLLTRAGVTVRADPGRLAEPVVVTDARSGSGDRAAAVYPVPFLDPMATARRATDRATGNGTDRPEPGGADRTGPDGSTSDGRTSDGRTSDGGRTRSRSTHQSVLADALRRIHQDRRPRELPTVVIAHAFVANFAPRLDETPVEESDSERALAVGGTDRVDQSVFDGIDYVALGHLHGPQSWDDGRITYSGSPIAYSFSEQHHRKGVRIVELVDGRRSVSHVELGVGRGLTTLTGGLDDLLDRPEHAHAEGLRVRAILTDPHLPGGAMARLRQRFPFVAELTHRPPERTAADVRPSSTQIRRRQPLDLAVDFVTEQWDDAPDAAASAVLRRAVTAVVGADR